MIITEILLCIVFHAMGFVGVKQLWWQNGYGGKIVVVAKRSW